MVAESLASHRMTQHGNAKEEQWSWNASAMGGKPRTYRIDFLTKGGPRGCPVEGFPGRAGTRAEMKMHLCNWHVREILIILEEGNLPHPRCSRCDMLVPWRALNGKHHDTAMCRSGAEQKRRRMAEIELGESTEMAFEAYGKQLKAVSSFKYLGQIMTAGDDDWPAVAGNLVKARKSWGRLTRIQSREGADKRISGTFFKAVVQQVLLFGAETWVMTPRIERALDRFMHGAARRITGRQPMRGLVGNGTTPL